MELKIKDKDSQVKTFKEEITKEAEHLINDFFPRKCIELNEYLKKDHMNLSCAATVVVAINLPVPEPVVKNAEVEEGGPAKKRKVEITEETNHVDSCKNQPGTKVFTFPNGTIPSNKKILEIAQYLKPEVRTLIEKCNTVRMWVTHLIPKIEDGNNFGVSIQEETLGEIRQVESESASFLDQIAKYFFTRGQIVAKAAKYPHVGDYRQFINELDEKEFLSLRLIASELRNHYSVLHDMILKNIEKIKKPRNANIEGMY
uniref:Proteasome activator PA28 C-terminal domain-containing protein n=1 Tax=Ciona savignyi TaxID=51511 RepID=H2YEN4_CIOSA